MNYLKKRELNAFERVDLCHLKEQVTRYALALWPRPWWCAAFVVALNLYAGRLPYYNVKPIDL